MTARAPYVVPALKKHTATVIMAHGLGDRSVNNELKTIKNSPLTTLSLSTVAPDGMKRSHPNMKLREHHK